MHHMLSDLYIHITRYLPDGVPLDGDMRSLRSEPRSRSVSDRCSGDDLTVYGDFKSISDVMVCSTLCDTVKT